MLPQPAPLIPVPPAALVMRYLKGDVNYPNAVAILMTTMPRADAVRMLREAVEGDGKPIA